MDYYEIGLFAAEGMAVILSILFYKYYKNTVHKYWMPFLIYTLLNELTAYFILIYTDWPTLPLYIVFKAINFTFLILYLGALLKSTKLKYATLILFYLAFTYFQFIKEDDFTVQLIGTIMVTVLVLLNLIKLLKTDEVIHFQKLPEFWICVSVLVFHLGALPVLFNQALMTTTGDGYQIMMLVLLWLYYLGLSLGFYYTKEKE